MSDQNDLLQLRQDHVEGGNLPEDRQASAPTGSAPGSLKAARNDVWPRPYAEVTLPYWEDSVDLERLHTAVEVRLAEFASMELEPEQAGGYIVGITSAVAGEGKTTVAMALAATVARNSDDRVCLVDLGLTEPNLSQNLSLPMGKTGLLDVLEGRTLEPDTVRVSDREEFVIVPAGRNTRHPAKMARSPHLRPFLDLARHHFDLVIVDLPAVASNNVQPIARFLDGLIMVACAGVTPKQVTKQALGTLDSRKVLGVVLNRVRPPAAANLLKRI